GASTELGPDSLAAIRFLRGTSSAVHPLIKKGSIPEGILLSLHNGVKGSLRLTPLTPLTRERCPN
ncbi:hypothetical protein, partial [Brevibacillus sp. MER 51]|uniref:hypothetical protein n=1 Tax=Brevibacillus sp. MER 51 TaxID=2939560 RepID=UPI00203D2DA7